MDEREISAEDLQESLEMCLENFGSFLDNFAKGRYRKATSDLFFTFECLLRTALFSIGIEPRSHEAVKRLFSYHFVKTKMVSTSVIVRFSNLMDRRLTAEYSRGAGWEFTEEELFSYYLWFKESAGEVIPLLRSNIEPPVQSLLNILEQMITTELYTEQNKPDPPR